MDTSRDVLLIDSIKRRQALDSMDMNDKPNQSDQLLKDKGELVASYIQAVHACMVGD